MVKKEVVIFVFSVIITLSIVGCSSYLNKDAVGSKIVKTSPSYEISPDNLDGVTSSPSSQNDPLKNVVIRDVVLDDSFQRINPGRYDSTIGVRVVVQNKGTTTVRLYDPYIGVDMNNIDPDQFSSCGGVVKGAGSSSDYLAPGELGIADMGCNSLADGTGTQLLPRKYFQLSGGVLDRAYGQIKVSLGDQSYSTILRETGSMVTYTGVLKMLEQCKVASVAGTQVSCSDTCKNQYDSVCIEANSVKVDAVDSSKIYYGLVDCSYKADSLRCVCCETPTA